MKHFIHNGLVACYSKKMEEWLSRPIATRNDPRPVMPEGPYVKAAMASDCDECRVAVLVQPVEYSKVKKEGDVSVPTKITPEPDYTPEPMPNADEIIQEKRDNVDGVVRKKPRANGAKRNGVKKR